MPLTPRRKSILAIWLGATALAVAFAAWTELGPVVLVVTRTHGVHLGDVFAAAVAYGGAALLTDRLRRRPQPLIGRS